MSNALFRGLTQKLFTLQPPWLNFFVSNHANKEINLVSLDFHANSKAWAKQELFSPLSSQV